MRSEGSAGKHKFDVVAKILTGAKDSAKLFYDLLIFLDFEFALEVKWGLIRRFGNKCVLTFNNNCYRTKFH